MKTCLKCIVEKDEIEFTKDKLRKDGLDDWCRNCKKIKRKQNYEKNKEQNIQKVKEYQSRHCSKIAQQRKEHYLANADVLRQKSHSYYSKHRREINRKHALYCKNRYHSDSLYRLRINVTNSISSALRRNGGNKRGLSCMKFLPYSIVDLHKHLENQFEHWMTWDNYGVFEEGIRKWNIDHIIPQSIFSYSSVDCAEYIACWSLSNLRPLEIIENIQKSNKLLDKDGEHRL